MSEASGNNKRIAKNTLLLYLRMFIAMGVSLYTSRVVLNVLGVEDFGIYNVVAGVVVMFSFINASMSSATSRFLTFEIGLGTDNINNLKKVFSSSLTVHLIIVLVIFILAETIGLWFLENKLVIASERMDAARWVYQLSIISALISIMQVPYNAAIIAHERMGVYAYIEIANVILKLLIVYILTIALGDKLITYGLLMLLLSIIITALYKIYCTRYFDECRFKIKWDKQYIYPMLSFSGWDLYGNMSVVARAQGVNMLLNMFFGAALNAAAGIAMQVQNTVLNFASNVFMAVRPQIVKSYASGNIDYMLKLVYNTSKYTYLLLLILSLPIILETHFVLSVWLKIVPEHAVVFCRLTLMFNFFANFGLIIISAIHATGQIKRPSMINGTLYLLVIPITYFAFKSGAHPSIPYIFNIIAILCGISSNMYTLHLKVKSFSIPVYLTKVFFSCALVTILTLIPLFLIRFYMDEGWIRFLLTSIGSVILILILGYFICLNKEERVKIINIIRNKIKH